MPGWEGLFEGGLRALVGEVVQALIGSEANQHFAAPWNAKGLPRPIGYRNGLKVRDLKRCMIVNVTVTRNEIITALHAPESFILALVMMEGDAVARLSYLRRPFTKEPDFGEISFNYDLSELLTRSVEPC